MTDLFINPTTEKQPVTLPLIHEYCTYIEGSKDPLDTKNISQGVKK